MSNTINQIREALVASEQTQTDLVKLESYGASRPVYAYTAHMVREFMLNTHYDNALEKFITGMSFDERHNQVSRASYAAPAYGIKTKVLHELEEAKVAFGAMLIDTYISIFGSEKTQKTIFRSNRPIKVAIDWIGDQSLNKKIKDLNFGLSQEAGLVHRRKSKGKAGIQGMKIPKQHLRVQEDLACMEHDLVTDITGEQLMTVLLASKEYVSTQNGAFLVKGRKYSATEKKMEIKERLEMLVERYKLSVANFVKQVNDQQTMGYPLHLSYWYDYRGRTYAENTDLLLNPQGKLGKYLYQAHTARILNTIDYKWIVFSIVSANYRVNPNEAIAMFEEDEDNMVDCYLGVEVDFMESIYRNRVVQALEDYRTQTPNATYIFKDYTNGGAIHFASGLTREPKALGAVNLLDVSGVNDPHDKLRLAFNAHTELNATRDDIKKSISQGITAGVSAYSAIQKATQYFKEAHGEDIELTQEQYLAIVTDVYGKTGLLFHEYNQWGKALLNNERSVLYFKTKDLFPAMSIAYIKAQEVTVYYPSVQPRTSENLKKITIHRDMPMHYIYESKLNTRTKRIERVLVVDKRGTIATIKNSGFLANVTHGNSDAVSIRKIVTAVSNVGGSMIPVHDNIITQGMIQDHVMSTAKADILENFERLPFAEAAEQVATEEHPFNRADFVLNKDTYFNIGDNFMQA